MSRAGRIALLALLALPGTTACDFGTGSDTGDDTAASGDGDGDGDTATGDGDGDGDGDGNALVLEFDAKPKIPGETGGDFAATIEVASMTLRDVRVIGDASTLDARSASLDWASADVERLRYAPVVPGLYSRVRGEVTKLELGGTLRLEDGLERNFEIKGDGNMLGEFSTDIAARVGPNEEVIVTLTAELEELIEAVPWAVVCGDNFCGVGKNDPAFAAVAARLREVFEADDDDDDDDDEHRGDDESF